MSSNAKENSTQGGPLAWLWVGMFASPVAFLLHLQIGYMLVPWACVTGHLSALYLTTLGALAITVTGALSAWRGLRLVGAEGSESAAGPTPRSRFMALTGILLSSFFFLVIIAQGVQNFILTPCQP